MTVQTDRDLGGAVTPGRRIPARRPLIAMSGWVSMRTLYLVPRMVSGLPRRCCVVAVPPLLRQLILQVIARACCVEMSRAAADGGVSGRSAAAVAAHRWSCAAARRGRCAPRFGCATSRARRQRQGHRAAGASRRRWSDLSGEFGMSLGRWRQRARCCTMRLLAAGQASDLDRARGRLRQRQRLHRHLCGHVRHDARPILPRPARRAEKRLRRSARQPAGAQGRRTEIGRHAGTTAAHRRVRTLRRGSFVTVERRHHRHRRTTCQWRTRHGDGEASSPGAAARRGRGTAQPMRPRPLAPSRHRAARRSAIPTHG